MELRRSWFQLHREDGQTMTEYGVLLALIAIVVIVVVCIWLLQATGMWASVTNFRLRN